MAIGRFNKRIDLDLIPANIKPGISIFGVEGSNPGLISGENLIGFIFHNSVNTTAGGSFAPFLRAITHDNGNYIAHFGAIGPSNLGGTFKFFFLVINKTNGSIIRYIGESGNFISGGLGARYNIVSGEPTYTVIDGGGGGALRFSADINGFHGNHLFTGTLLTEANASASLFGKTISKGTIYTSYMFYATWGRVWGSLPTFNFT